MFLNKITQYVTIAMALCGLIAIVGIQRLQGSSDIRPSEKPPRATPVKPFEHSVAGSGILESLSENIEIGSPEMGLVTEVLVKVNDVVKKDQLLFQLDDRSLRAEELQLRAQQPIVIKQIDVAAAQLKKLEAQQNRLLSVKDPRAISRDSVDNIAQDVAAAKANLEIAEAQAQSMTASLEALTLRMSRLKVLAPKDGEILQRNIHPGEVILLTSNKAPIVLGETKHLQVRADIDEQNALKIRAGQRAVAYLKGNPEISFPLKFVHIEPYVVPKSSLTGASAERVDTRVLQVIYALEQVSETPLYVGQQVDIFIETQK